MKIKPHIANIFNILGKIRTLDSLLSLLISTSVIRQSHRYWYSAVLPVDLKNVIKLIKL